MNELLHLFPLLSSLLKVNLAIVTFQNVINWSGRGREAKSDWKFADLWVRSKSKDQHLGIKTLKLYNLECCVLGCVIVP